MKSKAIAASPPNEGVYYSYVLDIESESVKKYRVFKFYDDGANVLMSGARSNTVEAHVSDSFEILLSELEILKSGIDIPGSVVGSAFDIIHNSANRNAVSIYAANNITIFQRLGASAIVPLLVVKQVVSVRGILPIRFSDGTTADLVLTGVSGSWEEGVSFEMELDPGSAEDSEGNVIPEDASNAENFQGTYSNESSANLMMNYVQDWYSLHTSGGGSLSCSSSTVSGKIIVVCKRV